MNGMIGVLGTESLPLLIVIFSPRGTGVAMMSVGKNEAVVMARFDCPTRAILLVNNQCE
jgi:hypothetical protein